MRCEEAERVIHTRLDPYRENKKREFFRLSVKEAITVVAEVAEAFREQELNVPSPPPVVPVPPPQPTVREELVKAKDEAHQAALAWQQYNCEKVLDSDLAEVKSRLQNLRLRLSQLKDSLFRERVWLLFFASFRRLFACVLGQEVLDWFPAAMLIGAVPCAPIAIVHVSLKLSFWWTLAGSGVAFLATLIMAARNLYLLDHSEYADKLNELARWVKERRAATAETKKTLAADQRHLVRLNLIRGLQDRYTAASEKVKRVESILASGR